MARPTVLIVDDHYYLSQALERSLRRQAKVIGHAAHASAGVAMAIDLSPSVVVSDIHMPGMDAFTACGEIVQRTSSKVLFFTGFPRDDYCSRAIAAGASGMACKGTETGQQLGVAIRRVAAGDTYWSAEWADRIAAIKDGAPVRSKGHLTPREIAILHSVAEGRTQLETAEMMRLHVSTILRQSHEVQQKLGAKTLAQALLIASQLGIIHGEFVVGAGDAKSSHPGTP